MGPHRNQTSSVNIPLSSVALKLLNDLYRTGLFGATPEDTARQLPT